MEFPRHLLKPDSKTLRQFAWGWVIFFGALAICKFAIQHRTTPAMWLGVTAIVGVTLNLVAPIVFRWIFVIWMVAAYPIGWVVSQVALALMFYCIITPVALIFRMTGRDGCADLNRRMQRLIGSQKKCRPMSGGISVNIEIL